MPSSNEHTPILITGATGHTGRRLAQRLVDKGLRVRCLLHNRHNRDRLPQSPNIEIVEGSAEAMDNLLQAIRGVETVIHLAHIRFGALLMEAFRADPQPRRLICTSSTRLFSQFPSPTREAVRHGEVVIQNAPPYVVWTILRPSMIFGGPDDNNLERMAHMLRRWRFFPLFGSGENLVQPLFVMDLVDAIVACMDKPKETISRSFTLAGPDPIPYREMVEEVARACGAASPIFLRLPYHPSLWLAKILRAIWPGCPLNPEMIQRFGEDRAFAIAPAQSVIGFSPTPFPEALEKKFKRLV